MQGLIFLVETHRRWAMKFVLLLLGFVSFVIAQNTPEPFGLKLRVSTKEETLQVMKKEGGRVMRSGNRIIKGDIVKALPVDGLQSATFWFFEGKLFKHRLHLSSFYE